MAMPATSSLPSQGVGGASEPIIRFVSNDELNERNKEADRRQNEPMVIALASHIQKCWQIAKQSKEPIDRELIKSLRQRNGHYEPDKLNQIREEGGSEIFMMLTAVKCRSASAWIEDIIINSEDRPWSVEPTPVPNLHPEIEEYIEQRVLQQSMQAAMELGIPITPDDVAAAADEIKKRVKRQIQEDGKKTAKLMEDEIADQFEEGGFKKALREFILDLVTYKAGVLKGPVMRRRKVLKWVAGRNGWIPIETMQTVPTFHRVSPFDCFPGPDARSPQDSFWIERHRISIGDLEEMKGAPGYHDASIDAVIETYRNGGLREWLAYDYERSVNENRPYEYLNPVNTVDAIEFWGPATGFHLREWGLPKEQVPDPTASYQVQAWMIGRWVIKAVINKDTQGRRPYYMTSYEKVPGSLWGHGVPELMSDDQAMLNAAARALDDNMGMASGPQVAINDIDRIPSGEDITSIRPRKIWQFSSDRMNSGSHRPPIEFFQANSNAQELLMIYERFSRMADEHTNIPAYAHGDAQVGGAGKTASGLSMLLGQATRAFKSVITNIDSDVLEPLLTRMYHWNMLNNPDPTIKGDLQAKTRGSSGMLIREQQQVRRMEFLGQTANPMDYQIMGPMGRGHLLKEAAKSLDMEPGDVVPGDEDEILERIAMSNAMGQQGEQAAGPRGLDNAGAPVAGQDAALFPRGMHAMGNG